MPRWIPLLALVALPSTASGAPKAKPAKGPCATAKACFAAGIRAHRAKRYAAARRLLVRACERKHPLGCLQLGNLLSRGLGGPKAPKRALARFAQACGHGALRGCYNAGVCHYGGVGTKKDPKRALPYFMRGCILGHGPSCYNAGVALWHGKGGIERDRRRAKRMFLFGCKLGEQAACKQLPPKERTKAKRKAKGK